MSNKFDEILEKELIPAMGCTEPIAIAYAGAKAREVLGDMPDKLIVKCSGNIIKNVKGVVVPSTTNMRGIDTSAIIGVLAGNAQNKLEVLKDIPKACIEEMLSLKAKGYCTVELAEGVENLYIDFIAQSGKNFSEVVISGGHTNIVKIVKNGETLFEQTEKENSEEENEKFTLREIYDYATTGDISEIIPVLKTQIEYNEQIAEEGLNNSYGANVGKTLMKHNGNDVSTRAKAAASAASDARMAGCELPVVINSGSGNQGITVSVPVIEYAKELKSNEEELYRALVLSNLVAILIKRGIGKLSAYCGVVGAACGAGAGIGYLHGDSYETISWSVTNTLGNVSGIICDGAKASCAAKIASSLDAAIMGRNMALDGEHFMAGEGIIEEDANDTISNIWRLGKEGMKETDIEILKMMIED